MYSKATRRIRIRATELGSGQQMFAFVINGSDVMSFAFAIKPPFETTKYSGSQLMTSVQKYGWKEQII